MSLVTGSHVGPYEIVAPLGAGGMGEVYRARDAKLGRDVSRRRVLAVLNDGSDGARSATVVLSWTSALERR